MKDAVRGWESSHPGVKAGMYVDNSVAVGAGTGVQGAKHMVAKLRSAQEAQ
eukprot:CAMPEP_0118665578 /NCGR_PEP_ID=MMETSP0785-20121206/18701_1 /TAXON_ID=91992 /ORGANISM="Bolidomonas pacifica, Strain CCMP 1866" /LENGTH=50 /DNA_ID=CAMNT_0006559721 /DNA_START=266 /DNA_END=415 /DNA_ORIENTATION=-